MMTGKLLENAGEWHLYQGQDLSASGILHIFKIDVSIYFKKIIPEKLLSYSELNKATRFLNAEDRNRYTVGKYFLRILISRFLDIHPCQINYVYTGNKKPHLPQLQFNLSHTKNYVLIAISNTPVGIDSEFIDPDFDYKGLLESCFSIEELSFIQDNEKQLLNFYTLWTRKEALLKATGEGLTDDLYLVPSLSPLLIRHRERFAVRSFKTLDNYLISTAFYAETDQVHLWEYAAGSLISF